MKRHSVLKTIKRQLWIVLTGLAIVPAVGQLQITEILYDSEETTNEAAWEWVEVHNPTGAAFDLDGYYFDDDDGNSLLLPNIVNVSSGGMATTTVIPAGGTAVIYNGGALDYDNSRFENAWGIAPGSVPLIAADSTQGLSNSGDAIGIWSASQYAMDIGDGDMDGDTEVLQFTNATASRDFVEANGFPNSGTGFSVAWNGTGSYQDNAQWAVSEAGVAGAVESVATFLGTSQINNTDDYGSPGVSSGGIGNGLQISEIMYNPASSENDWEWIEVVNTSGSEIDFSMTPWTLGDGEGTLGSENITSGVIPADGVAILYNSDDITMQNIVDAWDPGNANGVNFIPTANFPQFANSADQVALWDMFGDYVTDNMAGTFGLADSFVDYTDDPPFPPDNNSASIFFNGTDWMLSTDDSNAFGASPAFATSVPDHVGGDEGSPGFFDSDPPGLACDFDGDADCDLDDVHAMYPEFGGSNATFDLDNDGDVDNDDLTEWLAQASTADPMGRVFLRGDSDLDGDVDGPDFTALAANFGTNPANWSQGNFVVDAVAGGGETGGPDFTQLAVNFGHTSVSSVPEPGSMLLLALGFLAIGSVRRNGARS